MRRKILVALLVVLTLVFSFQIFVIANATPGPHYIYKCCLCPDGTTGVILCYMSSRPCIAPPCR